ncbi:MAG: retropepsin-like aspartic protease [Rhodanobacter sp.]
MLLTTFVCGVIATSLPLSAHPDGPENRASTLTGDAAVMLAVDRALAEADVPTLARMYQTSADPVSHVLAAMALERIHLNLDKSSEDARLCERGLIDSKPEVAFFCAKFANGNLRLSRGASQANADELDIVRRFAGKLPRVWLDQLKNFVAEHAAGPQLQVLMPSHSFNIPVVHSLAHGNLPIVEAETHGKKTWLLVDTGSSTLTLDEAAARDLGVAMLDRTGKTGGFLSRDVPVRYGTLDELRIGELTLLNVPVAVTAGNHRLIGIDILRQLGEFRLAEKSITVGESMEGSSACKEPMLVASNLWGTGLRVVSALSIDGQLRTTLLDSGSSQYLAADQHTLDELHSSPRSRMKISDIGEYQHAARVSRATADVDISGQPFSVTFEVFKDASLPWHYVLGSGALPYMDFYFNFHTRHTCLVLHHDLH